MSSAKPQTIAELLAQGESIEAALRACQPPGESELLERCAVVHQFDAELVEVLRSADPPLDGITLEDLVSRKLVELVPGTEATYRLPPSRREEHYARWWAGERPEKIPDGLRALAETIFEHLDTRPGAEVEALYQLLIVDPREGLERFEKLFETAEADFDLGRCQDYLDVMIERVPLLGPDGAAVSNRYRRRLRSRAIWMRDWHRSGRFLLTAQTEASTEHLLGGGSRVLSLWAQGGMGKTSYLRWLIARRCAPAGDACAKIDFDDIDPLLACREPHLLLLEAASQLDQQLTDAPFHELLAQYPGERERLRGRTAGPTNADPDDIRERFPAALAELPASVRVVIVLDTLEVALLLGGGTREQTDLLPMLEYLGSVLEDTPSLRLVLTARYPLSDRVRGFSKALPTATTVQLQPFTDEESHRYLTECRGITRPDLIERIIRSGDGLPFKLELIADVAEARPDLDPQELDEYVDADLEYVMKRVIGRVDPDLQTLLHYGVVPRRLERRFVHEVLAPMLDPGEDGVDGLWRRLKRYAGDASWVSLDPVEVDAVHFHQAILEPMRKLMRKRSEHDELHRLAEEWYERRAADDPTHASRWLCEAVYHRFQRSGPDGRGYWEQRLREARAERRPDRRRALAAEVLKDDYADGDGVRSWRDGTPLISDETQLRARWELAFAAVQLAHPDVPDRRDGQWLEAARALKDLEHLQRAAHGAGVGDTRMALLRAGLSLVRGDVETAKPHLERALRGNLAREDRLWLWLAYAGAVSARGDDEAAQYFRTARTIAERGPKPADDLAAVNERLAFHYADHDHVDRALAACEAGAAHARGRQAVEFGLVRAQLELRRGAPSVAIAHLPDVAEEESDVQARREIVHIRALLEAGRTLEARDLAFRTSERYAATLLAGSSRRQALAAEGRELRGKVSAALFDVKGAIDDFEEAAARWSRIGATDGVCRCWVRGAAMYLRGLGSLHEAAMRLDQARRTRGASGQDAWTRCTLVGADLLGRKGELERAARLVDDAIRALRRANRPPRAFIAAALQGLAVAAGSEQEPLVRLLCEQLAQVTPAAARLPLLAGIERCERLPASPRLLERLRRLVPSPLRDPSSYADIPACDLALLMLRDAELDRVCGRMDRAERSVARAAAELDSAKPGAAFHTLVGTAVRIGTPSLVQQLARRALEAAEARPSPAPVLDGATLVLAAGALTDADLVGRLLDAADALLDEQGAAAGAWAAELLELRARQAGADRRSEMGRRLRRRAAEVYQGLGDDLARDRLLGDPVTEAETRSDWIREREVRVTIRVRDGEVRVSPEWRDRRAPELRDHGERALAGALLDARAGSATPASIERLVREPRRLGHELAALLRDAVITDGDRVGDGKPWDLGLRSKVTAVRALPWELAAAELEQLGLRLYRRSPRARGEPADIRGVQGALTRLGKLRLSPDGILGPDTVAALERFQSDRDLPVTGRPDPLTVRLLHARFAGERSPWVAVVRPSRIAEERAARGSWQSGVPVDWLYERAGFRPLVLDSPTGDELMDALHRRPVAILHLNVGLVDHHGTPAIDLLAVPAVKARPPAAGRLTGTALDRVIPRNLPAPLVVLDVPAPKTIRETISQLLLRNVFAAELAAVGTVRAVMATGLAQYSRQERLYDALFGTLRNGDEVCDVAAAVRRGAGNEDESGIHDALAFTATALFARSPAIRFPAPA